MSKDEQDFIILRRLSNRRNKKILFTRKEFEKPEEEFADEKSIPHATLVKRLSELLDAGEIHEYETGKRSKSYIPIMEYGITSLGFVHLLRLCYCKEYQEEVFENLERLQYVSFHIQKLLNVFTNEQLFDALTSVCYNTIIEIDRQPFDSSIKKKFQHFRIHTVGEELRGKKGIEIYYITIRFPDVNSTQYFLKRIPSFAKVKSGKKVFGLEAIITINKMIACAFLHELFLRCSDLEHDSEYPVRGRAFVMRVIKTDSSLKETYYEFLSQMEERLYFENKQVQEIRSMLE